MREIILKLNENELFNLFKVITEDEDFEYYDDMDFFDAFLIVFKEWMHGKLGDEMKKYPISYLLKKYGREFEKDLKLNKNDDDEDDEDYEENIHYRAYDRWRIMNVAKVLVKKGKVSLPTLNTNLKFTEKYKKQLPLIRAQMELPDYVTIDFREDKPNILSIDLTVDFIKYITSEDSVRMDRYNIQRNLQDFLTNFMGIEFGNPAYGQMEMNIGNIEFLGRDEWVKNVFTKKIKKEIKQLPNSNLLHSIRLSFDEYGKGQIKLIFKDIYSYGTRNVYQEKREFKKSVDEYIKGLGYNTNILRVTD